MIKKYFGINPEIVLDPTLLINKKYYYNLIKNHPNNSKNNDYIFVYKKYGPEQLKGFILKASNELNYNIYNYKLNNKSKIEDFIYFLANSKAVITNSYHGTIFAIIFNKPFVSFSWKGSAGERLNSLANLLRIKNRIICNNKIPETKLLIKPLNINIEILNKMKIKSINFIKKNLSIK